MIVLMSFVTRAAGADWFGMKTVFGILFAIPFGFIAAHTYGHWSFGIIGFLVSWRGFELGHGTFYEMNGYHDHNSETGKPRIQTIEKVIRTIYTAMGGNISRPLYSWWCMGVKGAIIGAPLGLIGLLLVILWPVAYWIGHRVEKIPAIAEWVSGMFAGTVVLIAYTYQ